MKPYFLFIYLCSPLSGFAQDDLMKMATDSTQQQTAVVTTFKGNRVINGQSVETMGKNNLDFLISHRFGRLNQGIKEFFGLDAATVRFSLEYGLTSDLMIGVGRGSYQKNVDVFTKYRILKQTSSENGMPLSLTGFASYAIRTQKPFDNPTSAKERSSYTGSLLIARKFSEQLSVQISPTLVYRQLPDVIGDKQLVLASGVGARFKLTKRTSFNGEWFYVLPNQIDAIYTHNLSFGFDIETGGHVFQLHFTNSYGMTERQFITETIGSWGKGDVQFGFNISRTFSFNKKNTSYEKY